MKKYVYEVVVCDESGTAIDSVYFSSHKAAQKYKPKKGHVSCICQWPVFTEKDLVED